MTNRVTPEEVKEIISTDLSDPVLLPFITAANLTITDLLGGSTVLSAAQLKELERWFAAHLLACTREQQAAAEWDVDAKITYQGKTDKGLDATFYGQQCKILDTTGTLAAKLGKKTVDIYAITSFE